MSVGVILLKYFQNGGSSGSTGSRGQRAYFKWDTIYSKIFEFCARFLAGNVSYL